MNIPFNKIYMTGKEMNYIQDCLERGDIAGNGFYTHLVQEYIHTKFGSSKALLTNSGTAALEMAALLINLRPEDEVIMPSFTFVSTANAVMLRGARPVFVDIDRDTLNIDCEAIQEKINSHTRAIIPVHYGGIACNMDKIMNLAQKYNLYVIEDAAQGVNAAYKDKYLGTIGHIGCYSFHGTKNYVCGEGGAILLNTVDEQLMDRAELIWEKGTNRNQFLRGHTDKYTWMDVGSSYLPSDLLAAFLYAQLEELESITSKRESIYNYFYTCLLKYHKLGVIRLPSIPPVNKSNFHLFHCLFNSKKQRDYALDALRARGIQASFHYIPLHSSPMGRRLGYQADDLPVTEDVSSCLLRLPIYPDMNLQEQEYVAENFRNILDEIIC